MTAPAAALGSIRAATSLYFRNPEALAIYGGEAGLFAGALISGADTPLSMPAAAIRQPVRAGVQYSQSAVEAAQRGNAGRVLAEASEMPLASGSMTGVVTEAVSAPKVVTSNTGTFYHATSESAVRPIIEGGFRIDIPNPQAAFHNNRFGSGVYLADRPSAALAERPNSPVLRVEADLGRNLDITSRGPIYDADMAKSIARGARKHGFDSITTPSVQSGGGVNTIIFDPQRARSIEVAR